MGRDREMPLQIESCISLPCIETTITKFFNEYISKSSYPFLLIKRGFVLREGFIFTEML